MTTTRTATWTAAETDNGFGVFMDGHLVRDGYDRATAARKAADANAAEITAARLAASETDPEARFGRKGA